MAFYDGPCHVPSGGLAVSDGWCVGRGQARSQAPLGVCLLSLLVGELASSPAWSWLPVPFLTRSRFPMGTLVCVSGGVVAAWLGSLVCGVVCKCPGGPWPDTVPSVLVVGLLFLSFVGGAVPVAGVGIGGLVKMGVPVSLCLVPVCHLCAVVVAVDDSFVCYCLGPLDVEFLSAWSVPVECLSLSLYVPGFSLVLFCLGVFPFSPLSIMPWSCFLWLIVIPSACGLANMSSATLRTFASSSALAICPFVGCWLLAVSCLPALLADSFGYESLEVHPLLCCSSP